MVGQDVTGLFVWIPGGAWGWICPAACPVEARLCGLAEGGAFFRQSRNPRDTYPGILSGNYPIGFDKAAFQRAAAAGQAG